MLTGIASLLSAGALGALLKIFAAVCQQWMDGKRLKHEVRMAELNAHARVFYGESDSAGTAFTRWTRRMLALSITWTFCAVLLCWAWWPGVEILTLPGDQPGFRLLWGLVDIPRTAKPLAVTTGGFVWLAAHWVTMILTAYFMPIGRK